MTPGAVFDYEQIVCHMPIHEDFKSEVEKVLGGEKRELRLPFSDEKSGKQLLLFLEKGYEFRLMRTWILRGICELKDYTEEMERDGSIKKWLEVEII